MVAFTSDSSKVGHDEFIPAGTLAYMSVSKWEMKKSQTTGGGYAGLELTVVGGPYAKRKIFVNNLMDPDDALNSEKARAAGMSAMARMLEAVGVFNPADMSSYSRISNLHQCVEALYNLSSQGKTIAVKVGIEKGKGGYPDKNAVTAYLSPNPANSDFKFWKLLQSGGGAVTSAPPTASAPGFGGGVASAPGFGGGSPRALAAPTCGRWGCWGGDPTQ
jgi:hypothetical protein